MLIIIIVIGIETGSSGGVNVTFCFPRQKKATGDTLNLSSNTLQEENLGFNYYILIYMRMFSALFFCSSKLMHHSDTTEKKNNAVWNKCESFCFNVGHTNLKSGLHFPPCSHQLPSIVYPSPSQHLARDNKRLWATFERVSLNHTTPVTSCHPIFSTVIDDWKGDRNPPPPSSLVLLVRGQ